MKVTVIQPNNVKINAELDKPIAVGSGQPNGIQLGLSPISPINLGFKADSQAANLALQVANDALANVQGAIAESNLAISIANSATNTAIAAYALAANNSGGNNSIQFNTQTLHLQYMDITTGYTTTTANNVAVTVDTFAASLYTTFKYLLQVQTAEAIYSTEILGIQNGVTPVMTEYAALTSNGNIGSFGVVVSGPNINMVFIPYNPLGVINNIKWCRQSILT